jgi:hypothetical protein
MNSSQLVKQLELQLLSGAIAEMLSSRLASHATDMLLINSTTSSQESLSMMVQI